MMLLKDKNMFRVLKMYIWNYFCFHTICITLLNTDGSDNYLNRLILMTCYSTRLVCNYMCKNVISSQALQILRICPQFNWHLVFNLFMITSTKWMFILFFFLKCMGLQLYCSKWFLTSNDAFKRQEHVSCAEDVHLKWIVFIPDSVGLPVNAAVKAGLSFPIP
jgi:hypothetical protein